MPPEGVITSHRHITTAPRGLILWQDIACKVYLRELPCQLAAPLPRVVEAGVKASELLAAELVRHCRHPSGHGVLKDDLHRLDRPAHRARHQQLGLARAPGHLSERRLRASLVREVWVMKLCGHLVNVASLCVRRAASCSLSSAPSVVVALAVPHKMDALRVPVQRRVGGQEHKAPRTAAKKLRGLLDALEARGHAADVLAVLRQSLCMAIPGGHRCCCVHHGN
mmetsp:Transcript_88415/g.234824  ORF Transcript_88415/g.234824 Transcript_88415/m.234824 type:complete len:224 (+) Transcript_88415:600-1271(+)